MIIRQEVTHALEPVIKRFKQQDEYEKKRYLTIKETAQYLGIGISTVHLWVKQGKLNKVYVGGAPRFDKLELDQGVSDHSNSLTKTF